MRDQSHEHPFEFPHPFGKYLLLEPLGRGSSGYVYLAHDEFLSRSVALKMLDRRRIESALDRQRFLQEARTLTVLDHPRIVALYDINEVDNQPYIAMECMEGGSAQQAIDDRGGIPWREATQWILDACEALRASHEAGMLHRDVKPANILLSSDGRAKLADFGLVKLTRQEDSHLTLAGSPVGTPSFMSPEQCRAEVLDESSDIYSLGATYFALLVGRPPYLGESPLQVMFAHCSSPVPSLRDSGADVPADCEAILNCAMSKNPSDRYSTIEDFAEALSSLLGIPVRPRANTKGSGRTKWPVRMGVALGLILATGAGLYAFTREPKIASPARVDEPIGVAPIAADAPSRSPVLSGPKLGRLKSAILDVEFSPSGEAIIASSHSGQITIWPLPAGTGKPKELVDPDKKSVRALAIVPSRPLMISGGESNDLTLWNYETGEVVARVGHRHQTVRSIAVSPEGTLCVTGGDIGWNMWDIGDTSLMDRGVVREGMVLVHTVDISPVQSQLSAASGNGNIWIHSLLSPGADRKKHIDSQVVTMAFGRTRCELVYASDQGIVNHWSTTSRLEPIGFIFNLGFAPTHMTFSPNRRLVVAVGSNDGTVTFFDLDKKRARRLRVDDLTRIMVARFSPDGESLALGDKGGVVRVVRVPTEIFSPPTPSNELVLDATANYLPTYGTHPSIEKFRAFITADPKGKKSP